MVLDGVGGHVHPRGERWGFLDWDFPGLRTAVHVDGTLNRRDHTDRGWTVELAFPWQGLAWLADGRALPPKDGDVWRIDCSRFEKIGRHGEVLNPCAGWTWNRHGHYDSHIPEVFPYVTFSTTARGSSHGSTGIMERNAPPRHRLAAGIRWRRPGHCGSSQVREHREGSRAAGGRETPAV